MIMYHQNCLRLIFLELKEVAVYGVGNPILSGRPFIWEMMATLSFIVMQVVHYHPLQNGIGIGKN